MEIDRVLFFIGFDNVGINPRNGPFSTVIGIVNLHPSEGTHWFCYINGNFHDSYGCSPPQELSKFFIKRNGYWLCSDYKIQGLTSKKDSSCASSRLCITYLTKVVGIDFKSAVLSLYYQTI